MTTTYVHTSSTQYAYSSERDALMFVAGYTKDACVQIRIETESGGDIHIYLEIQ